MTSNSKQNIKKRQNKEKQKSSFINNLVENIDLYKFVLNKSMTTYEFR